MAIRHAIRSLVRSPWYGVTAIGTITLTIALTATVFAVIDGVLFRPLPYPDPSCALPPRDRGASARHCARTTRSSGVSLHERPR
jgi:hypothetical protein